MSEKQGKKRTPITDIIEAGIIALINDWDPERKPLTQESLVCGVKCRMGYEFSRQGLMKREPIRLAFQKRVDEIHGNTRSSATKEPLVDILERRISEMIRELAEKDRIISDYKEMFALHRYNARQLGISEAQLQAPISPRNQREGSRG
jgi:hypothetical protein